MIQVFSGILLECWQILLEASPFVLFGFAVAGLLKGFLIDNFIARHIGENSTSSVLKASLLGIPLPLCSCGVIPAAVELRKQGASKGGSAAFLVSTPESGVDSIAITYALLDPVMTVIRPLAAFLTATITGLAVNRLPDDEKLPIAEPEAACCDSGDHESSNDTILHRTWSGLRYAFGDLLKDIGSWLLVGILIAGVISYLLPDQFFIRYLDNEMLSLMVMLLVGIPIYICASASTPVAAALILKGISPGAALVFLLAGPATNAATITIVGRFWGRKATVVYLVSIALCSLLIGWLTNRLYEYAGWDITNSVQAMTEHQPDLLSVLAAVVLLALIGKNYFNSFRAGKSGCGDAGKEADT